MSRRSRDCWSQEAQNFQVANAGAAVVTVFDLADAIVIL